MDRPEPIRRLRPAADLAHTLGRIDGRGYRAYRDAEGAYRLGEGLRLLLDHAQGDPFAAPSRLRLQVDQRRAAFPEELYDGADRARGLADALLRGFARATRGLAGEVDCARPGAEILPRSAVVLDPEQIELRFTVNLPARGRRILGGQARRLLLELVPELAERCLHHGALDPMLLRAHVDAVEDQAELRRRLDERGLVAFLADGAVLPRASGVSQRPLEGAAVVPLRAPESLRVRLRAPHAGVVEGLGIPAGVTLLCGGAFHGKSTLLDALARGVYDHPPGDGRERCVSVPDAVKLRAEPGRWVGGVDIRPFLGPLPGGGDHERFRSANASGSTSQAASLMEALEAGTRLLLLDEDSSAGNLLAQDAPMRALLEEGQEPILHLSRRLRQLHEERGVSTALALGGSGAAFAAADRVIQMIGFRPVEVTERAQAIAAEHGLPAGTRRPWPRALPRAVTAGSVRPGKGRKAMHVRVHGSSELQIGERVLDLRALEQLVSPDQARAIGWILARAGVEMLQRELGVRELLDELERRMDEGGLAPFAGRPVGDLARPRRQEMLAALSRLREVVFQTMEEGGVPSSR